MDQSILLKIMKNLISTISLTLVIVLSFSNVREALASASVETDFGPVHYLEDESETIDYKKTSCTVGLNFFISEKSVEYEEFMTEHFSNPDSSSNLLPVALEKFNAYRDMMFAELAKYRAKSGATTAGQFEILERCSTIVKEEIADRKTNLDQNFRAGAADRKALRLTTKYRTINDRFKDRIHWPFSQFLGRMNSFADGLPCYTNKCSK